MKNPIQSARPAEMVSPFSKMWPDAKQRLVEMLPDNMPDATEPEWFAELTEHQQDIHMALREIEGLQAALAAAQAPHGLRDCKYCLGTRRLSHSPGVGQIREWDCPHCAATHMPVPSESVDAVGTTMPAPVLDWVRQFPNQTIHIHITADGFVSLWNRDPNKEDARQAAPVEPLHGGLVSQLESTLKALKYLYRTALAKPEKTILRISTQEFLGLGNLITETERALSAMPVDGGWRPIETFKKPEGFLARSERVLVGRISKPVLERTEDDEPFVPSVIRATMAEYHDNYGWLVPVDCLLGVGQMDKIAFAPTHWMPLPPAPADKGGV